MKDILSSETWAPVRGYEGLYEVSNLGRVRGVDRADALGRTRKGGVLVPFGRYKQVVLWKHGRARTVSQKTVEAMGFAPSVGTTPSPHPTDELGWT